MDILQILFIILVLSFITYSCYCWIMTCQEDKFIRTKEITVRKASPYDFYPSCAILNISSSKNNDSEIEILEKNVIASSIITREETTTQKISEAVFKLYEEYKKNIEARLKNIKAKETRKSQIEKLNNYLEICKKTVEKESQIFLIDNGSEALNFTFNRQNKFTDLLITGLMIPMLLSVLNASMTSAESVQGLFMSRFLWFFVMFLAALGSYRTYKYFHNKKSMLNCYYRTELYEKVELLLDIFEMALVDVKNEENEEK